MLPDSKVMLIIYFLTILLPYVTCLQYKNGGYEILDLQSKSSDFGFEAANWKVYPRALSQGSSFTKCETTFLLGGYNVLTNFGYFSRTYTGLPSHNSVSILLTFWLIDKWDPQDYISVSISSQVQTFYNNIILKLTSNQFNWVASKCGDSNTRELPGIQTLITAPHTGTDLIILFTTYVSSSSSNRGFDGIRDVRITLFQQNIGSSTCSIAPDYTVTSSYACECPQGTYKNPATSQCEACSASCGSCFGPDPTDCFYCKDNYLFNGNTCQSCAGTCQTCSGTSANQCLSCPNPPTPNYLQPDFSCNSVCTAPYVTKTRNEIQYCEMPCLPPKFLYSDNTCSDSCNAPFSQVIAGSELLCSFPCKPDFFLDSDGACKASCLAPYKIRLQGNYRLCEFPCQSTEYLLPDGTCKSGSSGSGGTSGSIACGTFLISRTSNNGNNFCDTPCTSSQYTYENRMCLDKCELPLIVSQVNGNILCVRPAGAEGKSYNTETQSWETSCPESTKLVVSDLYSKCIKEPKKPITLGDVSDVTGKIVEGSLIGVTVVSTGNPTGILLGVLAKMFYYIKYFQTTYSIQLKEALNTWNDNFIPVSVNFDAPQALIDDNSTPLPSVFSQWDIHPSFIANFWNDFLIFLIGLGFVIMFLILERLAIKYKGKRYTYFISRKLKLTAINLLLTYVYNSFDQIVFCTVLEFKSNSFSSGLGGLSVAVSLAFILASVVMLTFHVRILRRYRVLQKKPKGASKEMELRRFCRNYENWKILFEDFKNDSFKQEACLLLLAARDIILNLILTLLYNHPFIEIILIMAINILMLIYLTYERPLKNLLSLIYQIVAEFLLFTVNCCVLIMVILDHRGVSAMDSRVYIGRYIISANIMFNVFVIIYACIRVYDIAKELYKWRKMGLKKIFEMMIVSQLRTMYITQEEGKASVSTPSVFGKTEDKASDAGDTGIGTSRRPSHTPQDLTFEISAKKPQELTSRRANPYLSSGYETRSIIFHADHYTERNYTIKLERQVSEYSVVDVSGLDRRPEEINQTVNEAFERTPNTLVGQGGIVSSPFYRGDADISLLSHKSHK